MTRAAVGRPAAIAALSMLVACGATPRPTPTQTLVAPEPVPAAPVAPVTVPAPVAAPTSPAADEPLLDPLIAWVLAHDVDALTVMASVREEAMERDIALTTDAGSFLCHEGACFALPFAAQLTFFQETRVDLVAASDPDRSAQWTFGVRNGAASLRPVSTTPRLVPFGTPPPSPVTEVHGRALRLAAAPTSILDGLAAVIDGMPDVDVAVSTLRVEQTRYTLVSATVELQDATHALLVRAPSIVARSEAREGVPTTLEEVVGRDLVGPFVLLRVEEAANRSASSSVWSVHLDGARAQITEIGLGGVDGYGEACEREEDGYCVWLDACLRDLVVDGPDRAHLGPPIVWSAEHRRASDRWLYGTPTDPPEGCPAALHLCVSEHGLAPCAP